MGNLEVIEGDASSAPISDDKLKGYERTLLSAVLEDGDSKAAAIVAVNDFRDARHRTIWQAVKALEADGQTPDAVLVGAWLTENEQLAAAGGEEYLVQLVDIGASIAHVRHAAERIFRASVRRRAMERLQKSGDLQTAAEWEFGQLARLDGAAVPPTFRTMSDYLADPDILKPPSVVVPRLVWRSGLAMLAAEEKLGKSTLMAAGVAAASAGRTFLGESTKQAVVAYVTIDEPVSTTIANLNRFGADPNRVYIVTDTEIGTDRIQGVANAVESLSPDGTVIDSLWKLTAGVVTDSRDAAAWAPALDALTNMAHRFNTGVTFAHHAKKSDGRYRDSSAIGAACDVLLEMLPGDGYTREVKVRGRWPMDDFSVRLNGDTRDYAAPMYYTLAGGHELPLDLRVYRFIESQPGCSKRAVRMGVQGNNAEIDITLDNLEQRGLIKNRGNAQSADYHVTEPSVLGHGQGTVLGTLRTV